MSILEVDRVSISYGKAMGIQDITFAVEDGEAVGVIGPNGAGKTSLLRAVAGLNACSGSIRFKGMDISRKRAFEVARFGVNLCPEGCGLFPELTVRRNMDLGAYGRDDAKDVARDLDKAFSLFPVLKTRSGQLAHTLSGGEKQMLAIARAIMSSPQLLMLDEPSVGLALLVKESISKSILKIKKEGVTILLAEQDVHMAMDIVSRLMLLENGRIRMEGSDGEMRNNPYVKEIYLGIS